MRLYHDSNKYERCNVIFLHRGSVAQQKTNEIDVCYNNRLFRKMLTYWDNELLQYENTALFHWSNEHDHLRHHDTHDVWIMNFVIVECRLPIIAE